jgi:hypothetical protein
MGKRTATFLLILARLATHRATYKFLGVCLVAFGFANGETLMAGVMQVVCALTLCAG